MTGEQLNAERRCIAVGNAGGRINLRFNAMALALSVALVGIAGTALPATAQAQTAQAQQQFSIPAGTLREALDTLASQSGITVMYSPELVAGKTSRGLSGRFGATEALRRLLDGSGLEAQAAGDATFTLKQASQPRQSRPERNQRSASKASSEEDIVGMPAILVQGARTLNLDIRRTEDDPQPYIVFDREQIDRSLAVDLESFLKTRLPMNATQIVSGQSATTLGNQSSVNLRGLGAAQTLILVDGRRMPGTFNGGTVSQPDLNGIPLAAIERIEVLPSTASGIYGGGATGGVINIILRRDYTGGELKLTYENSFESDVAQRKVDARFGFGLGDRSNFMLTASYADNNPLLNRERDFLAQSRKRLLQNNPSAIYGAATPPLGYTPNIRSANGGSLVLRDGRSLNSAVTHVPSGYSGTGSDGGSALLANAGTYNLDLPDTAINGGLNAGIMNNPRKTSATATFRHEITDRVEFFIDGSYLDNEGYMPYAGFAPTYRLSASAAANPFQNDIIVTLPISQLSGVLYSQSITEQATGGLIVRFPKDWVGGVDYTIGRAKQFYSSPTQVLTPQGTAQLSSGAINGIRDPNLYSLDLAQFLNASPGEISGPTKNDFRDVMLRIAGPVSQLPGGPMVISGMLEQRSSDIADSFRRTITGDTTRTLRFPARGQDNRSAYLESRIPLVSEKNSKAGIHELELQTSVRYDEYTTRAVTAAITEGTDAPIEGVTNKVSSNSYTFAVRYAPFSSTALRASYGTGFLPPSTNQLLPRLITGTTTNLLDPRRGNTPPGILDVVTDGNPDLRPETSKSLSMGVIYEPEFAKGLRISLDYTKIEKEGEIARLTPQATVDNEDTLPERIVRGAPLPTDPAGWAGPITRIDLTFANVSESTIAAYDLRLEYERELAFGSFSGFAAVTRQETSERRLTATSPMIEAVGFSGGPLQWRGNLGMTFSTGPWMVGWNATYFDSYRVYSGTASESTRTAAILNQGSETIPSQTYHDIFARYRTEINLDSPGIFDNLEINFGIRNIFNREPPILATIDTSVSSAYSTYGDPRLRMYSISLTKSF